MCVYVCVCNNTCVCMHVYGGGNWIQKFVYCICNINIKDFETEKMYETRY